MELKQLKTFELVAKLGSFTQAAEELNYAQSSVSWQIRSLEEELEVKLFERLGGLVALTKAGEKLLSYAEQILQLSQQAKEDVGNSKIPQGVLTIGAPESLCVFRLPPLLQEYGRRYPQVEIVLKLIPCDQGISWLRSNILDVAFLLDKEVKAPDLITKTLFPEPTILVAGVNHHLVRKKFVEPQDLAGETLVLTEKGCCYRSVLEDLLALENIKPGLTLEFGSIEVIKKYVADGAGATLLPQITVAKELTQGQLVNLNWLGPQFPIFTQLLYHKDKWLSPPLSALLGLIEEQKKKPL